MKSKIPFDLSRLAGELDNIEFSGKLFPIKGPGDFYLVPLAKLSLSIERLYEGLKGQNPDLKRADNQVNNILLKICPELVGDKEVFPLLELEEKLEILDTFNEMGQELNGPPPPENAPVPLFPEMAPEPTNWFEVLPRLQKFYGGSPRDWFNLEMRWLHAFSEQVESLKAENILDLSKANLAGTWPTSDEQKKAIEELIEQLQVLVEGIENVPPTQEKIQEQLENAGITVNRVEASPEEWAAIEKFFQV